MQEAVERYLKGYLIAQRWQLERTHDLGRFREAAGHFDARFLGYAVLAEKLTDRYWDQHYPALTCPILDLITKACVNKQEN